MLGERSFLSLFSKKDQYKFMSFLKKQMLLPIHDRPYYSKKSRSSSRTSLKERMIDYLVHVIQQLLLTRDRETSKTDFEQQKTVFRDALKKELIKTYKDKHYTEVQHDLQEFVQKKI